MACDLTKGRKDFLVSDVVGGIKHVYFVDFGDLGSVTLTLTRLQTDEVTDLQTT